MDPTKERVIMSAKEDLLFCGVGLRHSHTPPPPPLRPPFSPVQESTPVIWGGRLGNGAYLPVIYTVRGPDFLNRATGLVPIVSLCSLVLNTVYIRYFLPLVHFYFYFFLGSFFSSGILVFYRLDHTYIHGFGICLYSGFFC